MVQRHAKARFMSNSHVFPGGCLSDSDHCDDDKSIDFAHRVAAIRECYEETGLLICKRSLTGGDRLDAAARERLREQRALVQQDASQFNVLCDELGVDIGIAVEALRPWARWVTPEAERWRYDTRFYVVVLDDATHLSDASHQRAELAALEWMSPSEALSKFAERRIFLPPPTWHTLLEMQRLPTIDHVLSATAVRDLRRSVMPMFVAAADAEPCIVMPGDELHPSTTTSTAPSLKMRNRIIIDGGQYCYERTSKPVVRSADLRLPSSSL
jgi:8-oxo-dGTP pyrophosphatase MutT (NUDIX family)